MTRRPIQRTSPWPWVAFAFAVLLFGWLFVRTDSSSPPTAVAAPVVQTVQVVVTATPTATIAVTQTARVQIVTATPIPATLVPPCDRADPGDLCRNTGHIVVTPTPAPLCSAVPEWQTDVTCRKDPIDTNGKDQTE